MSINDQLKELPETKICTSKAHFTHDSPYPKNKVPIKEFIKEQKRGKIKICNTCSHCRNKRTDSRIRKKNERKEENLKQEVIDSNFKVCISECHTAEGVSKYPRDKVPKDLFLGRTKGKIYENCLDCIKHVNQIGENTRNNKKLNADPNEYFCPHCGEAINLDGTPSSRCTFCKEAEIKFNAGYREKRRNILKEVKLEKIKKNECCCQKCKSIFLKSLNNQPYIELKTYIENEIRYVIYLNTKYSSKDFLEKFENLLELRMIEFDHLTEDEQRERNIIQSNESFIEKKGSVTELKTEWDIREEAKITQILCCLCHMKETIYRSNIGEYSGETYKKIKYVNDLKIEKEGCEICNFFDPLLLRYLEFDHINPSEKIASICEMVMMGKYTLEDIIKECEKCRLLCKICHRLHTYKQINEGVFDNAYKNYPKRL